MKGLLESPLNSPKPNVNFGVCVQMCIFLRRQFIAFKWSLSSLWLKRGYCLFKKLWAGLPWWRSGWESACQCREYGFEPWPGRSPHATERLGPWATTAEPARLEPVLRNKRGPNGERPAHSDEEWPPLATTRESPRTETKTHQSQK